MTAEIPDEPKNREEQYLAKIAGQDDPLPSDGPRNRIEMYLNAIAENGGGGKTYKAGEGIDIADDTISVDTDTIQPKLTAGTGIDITNDTISATGGGGPTVVQTTGTSTTDVMSQNAVSTRIYPRIGVVNDAIGIVGANDTQDSSAGLGSVGVGSGHHARGDNAVAIGPSASIYAAGAYSTAVGSSAKTEGHSRAVALGNAANAANDNSVAIGTNSVTTRIGEVNVGAGTSGRGYNSTNYRVIGGVHDPIDAHDAATKGYVDGIRFDFSDLYSAAVDAYEQSGAAASITVAQFNAVADAIQANKFISVILDNPDQFDSLTSCSAGITMDDSEPSDWEVRFFYAGGVQMLNGQLNGGSPTLQYSELDYTTN